MANKHKLELDWYKKENKIKVEPRILIEDRNLSYEKKIIKDLFDVDNEFDNNKFENMLIHGDNLLALKALSNNYANKVKCVYIDPPYNTGAAFEHYDDNLEHSTWLSLMKPRLEILKSLLSDDGIIFVQIDYNEQAYLKVLMDEIFGRSNFLTMITCKVKAPSGVASGASAFFDVSEYILVYTKNKVKFSFIPTKIDTDIVGPTSPKVTKVYNKFFKEIDYDKFSYLDNFEDIVIKELNKENFNIETISKKDRTDAIYYEKYEKVFRLAAISGGRDKKLLNHLTELPNYDKEKVYSYTYVPIQGKNKGKEITNYIYKGQNILFIQDYVRVDEENKKVYKQDILTNIFYTDWWQGLTGEGGVNFKNGQKPEKLLHQLLATVTKEGDIILDSFLGSGTTIAVAHKMNRKWIGIEMGDHAYTHCKYRIDNIIDGKDSTGITKMLDFKGGGGYKFYELAPTLIKEDSFGQTIINPEYNAEMLASAVAKHEGYKYNPDAVDFWKQSTNDSKSYLFVTTKHITKEYLLSISSEMQDDEYLVIVCKSYDSNIQYEFKNIEIKKIPQSLLNNCEYDVDNYNLNIIHPPVYDEEEDLDD